MSRGIQVVAAVMIVGSALVGGVLFAFSGFVMTALRQLPAGQAIATMQSINRAAVRPPLMIALFGTAAACIALAIWALGNLGTRSALMSLLAAGTYLFGVIGVTAGANVPRNDRLERVAANAPDAADIWATYAGEWTNWNHVRTLAALVASLLGLLALRAAE